MKFNMRYPRLSDNADLNMHKAEIKRYLRQLVDEISRAFNGENKGGGTAIPSGVEIFKDTEWLAGTEFAADPSVIFGHTAFVAYIGSEAVPVQCLRSGSMIYGSLSVCTDTETSAFKHYSVQISCAQDGLLTLFCSHYSNGEMGIITALYALK